uniref:Putative nitrite reductase NirV n=1 Tax=uncultured bacterium 1062 TaxID=548898 RepID=B8R8W6_9BACT|nr:putative nitrite reductase NirV precursor [uncultured bacterium 1062]
MTHTVAHDRSAGLLPPGLLLAGLLALLSVQAGVVRFPAPAEAVIKPATVTIVPRTYSYRATGDFLRETATVDGPLLTVDEPASLEIMKYQVSASDYALCVDDGACSKAEPRRRGDGDVPVTGVSFDDATDYAEWLSGRTGETWRLPTVSEWNFAAGSKARDHALGIETDAKDPAERWLAFYERESALGANALATPLPLGTFGENEFGVADLAESVWEWTATCGSRTALGPNDETITHLESCGVRLLEGRHRTPMSAFVRDAQGGGCTTGAPPDNLGFRLVREPAVWIQLVEWVGSVGKR